MQTQKNIVRDQILTAAHKLFLEKDFMHTSMRDISKESKIGLSNIYNYFKNKDDIFKAIIQPVILQIDIMHKKYRTIEVQNIMAVTTEEYFESIVNDHVSNIVNNKSSYILLFYKSQGSSYGNFRKLYTDKVMTESTQYLAEIKKEHPNIKINISPFFMHFSVTIMLTLYEELTTYNTTEDNIKLAVREFIKFQVAGWRELMKI